ncbi:hypothetical protein MKZ38_005726 [Zalerion maritima]|uniref:Uncharacterized protein n=1 Tax=Zalerion maritima TaxID=339359 RepID=A0AAD5RKZ4_9PEZI|nr:hypothetical protein MKZ38_005726 [Zalerion maritima]
MDTGAFSVESCIQQFFNTLTTATRAECDIKASASAGSSGPFVENASLVGGPVKPVPVQGLWSYTVIAGPSQADIMQFRAGRSKLDMIGGQSPLAVYVIKKRDGVCYIQIRDTSPEGKVEFNIRQFRTVGDLASLVDIPIILGNKY